MLSAAFIHKPKLLFLDEPFANLDPIYQRKCRRWLLDHVKQGGTIFLCSHVLEMAERMCNRMAIINDGKVLAAGSVPELKISKEETLEDVFIRLVGRSIEDVERINEEGISRGGIVLTKMLISSRNWDDVDFTDSKEALGTGSQGQNLLTPLRGWKSFKATFK